MLFYSFKGETTEYAIFSFIVRIKTFSTLQNFKPFHITSGKEIMYLTVVHIS